MVISAVEEEGVGGALELLLDWRLGFLDVVLPRRGLLGLGSEYQNSPATDVEEHALAVNEVLRRTEEVSINVLCAILNPQHILLEVLAE